MRNILISQPPRTLGRKRRFGAAGLANVALTNVFLQILLLVPAIPAALCTLASQLFNGTLGYALYSQWVFRANRLRDSKAALRYALAQVLFWVLNLSLITRGEAAGLNRNVTALLAVPVLAGISYLLQKHWVFPNSSSEIHEA